MSKVLLLYGGLLHARKQVIPHMNQVYNMLKDHSDFIDKRDVYLFDVDTFKQYDTVVFFFPLAAGTLPSTILELLKKLEDSQSKANIYVVSYTDVYEAEKCIFGVKAVDNWTKHTQNTFKGSLMIGSLFVQDTLQTKLITVSYLKKMCLAIINNEEVHLTTTMLSLKKFLRLGNRYWNKQIKAKKG